LRADQIEFGSAFLAKLGPFTILKLTFWAFHPDALLFISEQFELE
jgi:hypothetical protein